MKLKDKVVLVTGASSGIGMGFALRAAKDGATVLLACLLYTSLLAHFLWYLAFQTSAQWEPC